MSSILVTEWNKKGSSMFDHEELFSGAWPGSKFILCFSSGYFVYDQVDMLRRHLYSPSSPSLLVHHAVLLVCFTMALYRQVTINYLILTLFCEVSERFKRLICSYSVPFCVVYSMKRYTRLHITIGFIYVSYIQYSCI